MTKSEILEEIRRTAKANGGPALGLRTFQRETGIRHADWFGIYWRSWSDALTEAGFKPNTPPPKIDDRELLRRYCALTRELGRIPSKGDLRLKKRSDSTFPSETTIIRAFGSYPELRTRAVEFCSEDSIFSDIINLFPSPVKRTTKSSPSPVDFPRGFVYLVKHGSRQEYKIGKTLNPLRREGEIRLQLPERLTPVHYIETDDPTGIEAYWHARFASKRKEGEWFELSREDVAAFKRWKRII